MAYLEMSSASEAAAAVALMNGACASAPEDPASGLRVSFVASTLQEIKEKTKKDAK